MVHSGAGDQQRSTKWARGLATVAFVWIISVSVELAFSPLGLVPPLQEREGSAIVVILGALVVVALSATLVAGRWARPVRIAATVVIVVFCLIGAASIGLFFAPAALFLVTACAMTPPAR